MTSAAEQRMPALAHLIGAYFHQDWADEFHDDEWAAVDAFMAGSPGLVERLPAEIARVLVQFPTDDDAERYLASLGCAYTPAPEDGGCREWLTEISRRVSAETRSG